MAIERQLKAFFRPTSYYCSPYYFQALNVTKAIRSECDKSKAPPALRLLPGALHARSRLVIWYYFSWEDKLASLIVKFNYREDFINTGFEHRHKWRRKFTGTRTKYIAVLHICCSLLSILRCRKWIIFSIHGCMTFAWISVIVETAIIFCTTTS